jgi:hypothetical protein
VKILVQTAGILGLTVLIAGLASIVLRRVGFRQALGPACLLVAAVAFLVPFPDKVRSDVKTARATYAYWAPLDQRQAYAGVAGQYGIDTAFIEWFRAQMKPGQTFYWANGSPPKDSPLAGFFVYHNHWITYQMLPYRAVDSPQKADVVMLYRTTRRQWRRAHPEPMTIQMYSPRFGIARRDG